VVCQSDGQTATVHVNRGNTPFDLSAAASPAASPTVCLSQRWLHRPGIVHCSWRQPETVLWRRGGAWWVPDCDGMLIFRLSIINRLIHNQISINHGKNSNVASLKTTMPARATPQQHLVNKTCNEHFWVWQLCADVLFTPDKVDNFSRTFYIPPE